MSDHPAKWLQALQERSKALQERSRRLVGRMEIGRLRSRPRQDEAESDPAVAENPETAAQPATPKDSLFPKLQRAPERMQEFDNRMFVLCREQVEGRGEDFYLAAHREKHIALGAFDGCGGSGAKVYSHLDGHTGAWAASRAAALAARDWFLDPSQDGDLAACIADALHACKAGDAAGQLLMGSLSREFPTTVSMFVKAMDAGETDFYWCGDSRCYVLDDQGLHQVTADDSAIQDAMQNLREDAPMTNVACASRPFSLHCVRRNLDRPSIILAATDGCFGYLPSPMAFERLLLETLSRASGIQDWKRRIDARIREVSGDDYTLVAWVHRFGSFREMKRALHRRLTALEHAYFQGDVPEEALFAQWEDYKKGYERMLQERPADGERG